MQATCIELLTSWATAHYVNGTVETEGSQCHFGPFVVVRHCLSIKEMLVALIYQLKIFLSFHWWILKFSDETILFPQQFTRGQNIPSTLVWHQARPRFLWSHFFKINHNPSKVYKQISAFRLCLQQKWQIFGSSSWMIMSGIFSIGIKQVYFTAFLSGKWLKHHPSMTEARGPAIFLQASL